MTTITNIISYFPRNYRKAIDIQKYFNNLNKDNGYNINKIWKTLLPITDRFPPPLPSTPLTILFFSLTISNK